MLKVIFTLDYEIHGNGQGSAYKLMIEPTERLLRLFDQYGAKLTIFADIAEILKFREYKHMYGRDDYCWDAIAEQLLRAIKTGHDVQLHIHSSYFNSKYEDGQWRQDWSEYNFADLPYERISLMVRTGKTFLESLLKPIDKNYQCIAFRAANWAVNPSKYVARALLDNNIRIDTSVFKYGRRNGLARFDYSSAHHALKPWPVDQSNFCKIKPNSKLWEFPIYSENRSIWSFITLNRIYRVLFGMLHKLPENSEQEYSVAKRMQKEKLSGNSIFRKYAWKADFNQCSGRQLIQALIRAEKETQSNERMPFTLIGHSKIFTHWNERSIRPFLEFVKNHPKRFSFGTYNVFKEIIDS